MKKIIFFLPFLIFPFITFLQFLIFFKLFFNVDPSYILLLIINNNLMFVIITILIFIGNISFILPFLLNIEEERVKWTIKFIIIGELVILEAFLILYDFISIQSHFK